MCILPGRAPPITTAEQTERMAAEPEEDLPDGDDDVELDDELDLDDGDIEEVDLDDELIVDPDLDDELIVDDAVLDDEDEDADDAAPAPVAKTDADDADEDDLEEVDPDDVEADLDTILKDRIAAADDEEEEDEEAPVDTEDRTDANKIQLRRPGEFVCQSCFLLKPQSQLSDKKRKLCSDCV